MDINSLGPRGTTLLMAAADNGEFSIVQYLTEKGADLNATGSSDPVI